MKNSWSIELSPILLPNRKEAPLSILLRMASVSSEADLGIFGPVIASLANKENSGNPAFRRYEAVFGRDALYTAAFLRDIYPRLEEGTIRYFSAYQAVRSDPLSLATRGKIAHHIRDPTDPLAQQLDCRDRTALALVWRYRYNRAFPHCLFSRRCAQSSASRRIGHISGRPPAGGDRAPGAATQYSPSGRSSARLGYG